MGLNIVSTESAYSKAQLSEPTSLGYIHIGAEVRPRPLPLTLLPIGRTKAEFIGRLKELGRQLEKQEDIETVTIFEAVSIPPLSRLPYINEHIDSVHLARFDISILIETSSPAAARDLQTISTYQALVETVESTAKDIHIMTARNEKRIGDVEKTRDGLFIFNHFVADDGAVMMELFEYLLGWFEIEMGLDNAILLVPLDDEDSDFIAVNHARSDLSLVRLLWGLLSKQSFRSYVLANLTANQVGIMPVLYRLA